MGGAHCVNLSAYVLSFCIPGSAFATLSAAGLTTNLPLAGQAMRIRGTWYISRWHGEMVTRYVTISGGSGHADMVQGVAFQATCVWGCACPGDNRQSPIGTGYSKMFVFQTKFDYMVGASGLSEAK
jgi:hypothetical protein